MKRYTLVLESDVNSTIGNDKFTKLSYETYQKNLKASPAEAAKNSKKLIKDLNIDDKSIFTVLANQISKAPSNIGNVLKSILAKVKRVLGSILVTLGLVTLEVIFWIIAVLFLCYFKVRMLFHRDSKNDDIPELNEAVTPMMAVNEKEVASAWRDIIKRYRNSCGIDLSYMDWNFSEGPRAKDGTMTGMLPSTSPGAWTSKKIIFLNPRMIEAFNYYRPGSVKTKRKLYSLLRYVIAHELAYEIWARRKEFIKVVQSALIGAEDGYRRNSINKKYLRNKSDIFAEYMAHTIVPDCIIEGVEVQEALFNSEYVRQFINYAYDSSLDFVNTSLDKLEEKFKIPRKAVGIFCFLICMVALFKHL